MSPVSVYQLGRKALSYGPLLTSYSRPRDHDRRKPEQWQVASFNQEQAIWLLKRNLWIHKPYDHVGILAHKPKGSDLWLYYDSETPEPPRYSSGDTYSPDNHRANLDQFFARLTEIDYGNSEKDPFHPRRRRKNP